MAQVEPYLHELYRARSEFVYSVTKEFARSCQTPILVLPDETPAHPFVVSIEVVSLCPNADITVFPWREPPELKARTIEKVKTLPSGTSTRGLAADGDVATPPCRPTPRRQLASS